MTKRLILITGGSSGIGKATAAALYAQGATVLLQARNLDKLQSAAKDIDPTGKRVYYYSTDLTSPRDVKASAEAIVKKHGLPDCIINCAGEGEWLSFSESNIDHYTQTIASPYLAAALTCKVFYDLMKERGSGHFIIVNSAAAYFAFPGATGYIPSRWGLLGFSKALQADLHSTNFTVSSIVFGKVNTPYFSNNPISESRIPKIADWLIPTLTAQQAGQRIAKTVNNPKHEVLATLMFRVMVFLNRLFPRIFQYLLRKTGHKNKL
jgi:short-subunit dehydrogenase